VANREYNRIVRRCFKLIKITGICIILVAGLAFPRITAMFLLPLPHASAVYDCDDAALATYRYFQSLGIKTTPIIGNLKTTGETYAESNHVWLLVNLGSREIAYDWGTPRFDRQHYEGYTVSPDFLENAAAQDRENVSGQLPAGQ
jgi:hypothetical protein